MSISFDKEVEVIENLFSFGIKLRKAFLQTDLTANFSTNLSKRSRIIKKVRDEIEEETDYHRKTIKKMSKDEQTAKDEASAKIAA